MLQAFRTKAAGVVVKILFALLIVSFAIWGIGDYAFLRQGDPTALKIGGTSVTASQLSGEYRSEIDRLRRAFGQLDAETARQFGLMDQVVQRVVTQSLLDQAAEKLGVRVGDDVLRARILAEPTFQAQGGQFDRQRFQQFLQQASLTEAGFLQLFRKEYTRDLVTEAIGAGARGPDPLLDQLYRYRNERRGGEMVFVPAAAFTDVGAPDDAQLQSVYEDNRERFTAPEYRALSVLRIGPEEVQAQVNIDDKQLEEEYRARLPELRRPERRELAQLLFADEAAAKAAQTKIAGGADFAETGKEAGQPPEQQALGKVTRDDLPPELAEPVFALAKGGVSAPVQSPFGWHLLKVSDIEPGQEPGFAEVKDRLAQELRARLAGDVAYELATKVEDAHAGGASLEDAAAKNGLAVTKLAAVDLRGQDAEGKPVPLLAGARDLLAAIFQTAGGRETQLTEGQEGVWYIARVDTVTPSALKPLAEVRADVVRLWQDDRREEEARKRAEAILAETKAGKSLEAASAPFNLKPTRVEPIVRATGFDPRAAVPPEVNSRLFSTPLNEVVTVPGREGVYVVRLTEIVAADPTADEAGLAQLRDQLRQQVGSDLVAAYAAALRQRYGVSVDQAVIDRLL